MTDVHEAPAAGAAPEERPPLRRAKRDKVLAGVCGGLGRRFDLDPVIFRVVLGVLAVTGGVGLLFYGFAWLLLPADGQEESEIKRMLTGRIDGGALAAVLLALVGCALFLSMLDNGVMGLFSVLVITALGAAGHWSHKKRLADAAEAAAKTAAEPAGAGAAGPEAPAAPSAPAAPAKAPRHRPEAPPETLAPPVTAGVHSWWREPLVKDGTTGPRPGSYLWGPVGAASAVGVDPAAARDLAAAHTIAYRAASAPPAPPAAPAPPTVPPPRKRGSGIGGRIFLLALIAAWIGAATHWHGHPLGQALQIGLACALGVFGLGLAVSSLKGRTGFWTLLWAVITAALLAGATLLPRQIGTDFGQASWRPASVADLKPVYSAGTGTALLDLSGVDVPEGTTVTVRAELDAGVLRVILPREVTTRVDARLDLGDVRLPEDAPEDFRPGTDEHVSTTLRPVSGTKAGGTIDLRLENAVGLVEVDRAHP
ncbi:PspC domain-containing protein [Streptomyces sp. BI20]|uniref:PspC domain-containing protein n=1 Tax=Streptomyces sp. BI20 TaxID=3403460 RepID=UPI003C76EBCB